MLAIFLKVKVLRIFKKEFLHTRHHQKHGWVNQRLIPLFFYYKFRIHTVPKFIPFKAHFILSKLFFEEVGNKKAHLFIKFFTKCYAQFLSGFKALIWGTGNELQAEGF